MKEISENKKLIQNLERVTTEFYNNNNSNQQAELATVNKEIEIQRKRLNNAQTLMLDGQIDANEYRGIKSQIEPDIEKLMRTHIKVNTKNPLEKEVHEFGIYFLNNMADLFTVADLGLKQKLVGLMFPKKLVFENKKYQTNIDDGILPLLINTGSDFIKKNGKVSNKFDNPSREVSLTDKISNHFKDFSYALYPLKKIFAKKNILSGKANVV